MDTLEKANTLDDQRPTLIQIAHQLERFDESRIVGEFAGAVHKKATANMTKAVRRVLRDLVEYGVLDLEHGQYSLRR